MKKYQMIFLPIFIFGTILFCQEVMHVSPPDKPQKKPEPTYTVELGIDSIIKNKDGSYQVAVYMLNEEPVAGYQMDFLPKNIFTPITMRDGISGELGYMMQASKTGKVIGFSMQGIAIPVASTDKQSDNILYYLDVEFNGEKGEKVSISFDTVIAGVKGAKLEPVVIPFEFILP